MKPILYKEKINTWFVVVMLLLASLSIIAGLIFFPFPALGAIVTFDSNIQSQQVWHSDECFYVNALLNDALGVYGQLTFRDTTSNEVYFSFHALDTLQYRSGCINLENLLVAGRTYDRVKISVFNGAFANIANYYPFDVVGEGLFQYASSTAITDVTNEQFAMVAGTAFFFVTIFTILYAFRGK